MAVPSKGGDCAMASERSSQGVDDVGVGVGVCVDWETDRKGDLGGRKASTAAWRTEADDAHGSRIMQAKGTDEERG